jgi:hypothetical protein
MKRRINDSQTTLDFNALFEIPKPQESIAGNMDYSFELRHLISDTLKACPLDRFAVAAEMSRLTGKEITKGMIDSWSAESRAEWRFPLEFAPAFEVATGTYALTEFMARKRSCKVYAGEDLYAAELGKLEKLKNEVNQKIKLLKNHMERKR